VDRINHQQVREGETDKRDFRLQVDRINHHNAREEKSEEERELNLQYSVYVLQLYGKIKPPNLRQPPDLLCNLLAEDSMKAKKFRVNISSNNNLLSFASKEISGKLCEMFLGGEDIWEDVLYLRLGGHSLSACPCQSGTSQDPPEQESRFKFQIKYFTGCSLSFWPG
jgi:hypothetical protein